MYHYLTSYILIYGMELNTATNTFPVLPPAAELQSELPVILHLPRAGQTWKHGQDVNMLETIEVTM